MSLQSTVIRAAVTAPLAMIIVKPAQASWQVSAQANTQAYVSGGLDYHSGNFRTCNGTAIYCSAPVQGAGADPIVYSHSDTATSAVVQANIAAYYQGTPSQGYGSAQSNAFASVDLATGELKISNSGLTYYSPNGSLFGTANHGSSAGFYDSVFFSSTSATSQVFTVGIHVDGSFLGYQQPNISFSMGNGLNQSVYLSQNWYDPSSTVAACVGQFAGCTNVAGLVGNGTLQGVVKVGEGDYLATLLYDPAHPNFTIAMSLAAGGPGDSFAAFEHTAGLTFNLPTGMTFTSDSGALLTADPTAAVPEPATWATMIAGFALVGGAMRRRSLQFAAG